MLYCTTLHLLQDSCRPVMTIYKLVTMDAPIWGLGERLEDCLIAVRIMSGLFLDCYLDLNESGTVMAL